MKKIDLHSHTYYSDGALSPAELVLRAHNMQLDALAITDHDTCLGVVEARAVQAQQARPMSIISGVELSTAWEGQDIHILGLDVNIDCPIFQQRLAQQGEARWQRAQKIAAKLQSFGMPDYLPQVQVMAGQGQITRVHFARLMYQDGSVASMQTAFNRYLAHPKRAYVDPEWISVATAVKWITEAGGIAVVAHPSRYDLKTKHLRRLLAEFVQAGGQGMEVTNASMSPSKTELMLRLADEYQLLASAGSDFHFPCRWTELGRGLQIAREVKKVSDLLLQRGALA